jgi:3-hydroxyisobutyrate dehydrogenase-like beta-hydroxyacid dehydrogenase
MGAALARCLERGGYDVRVWNRSPEKAAEFDHVADDPEHLIRDADAVVICVRNYETTDEALRDVDDSVLAGKAVFQMSTGTSEDARRHQLWFTERGAQYVDGAILASPTTIGARSALIFCSGDRAAYTRHEAMLEVLAGGTTFLDEAVGAAAVLDCALLQLYYSTSLAALQGAAMCDAEGFPIDRYLAAATAFMPPLANAIRQACERAMSRDYIDDTGGGASLAAHHAATVHLGRLSRDLGVSSAFPDFIERTYADASNAGYVDAEKEAIFEMMRRRSA